MGMQSDSVPVFLFADYEGSLITNEECDMKVHSEGCKIAGLIVFTKKRTLQSLK